jgi:caspase domain-containing protein/Sel1 repeat-containing protein
MLLRLCNVARRLINRKDYGTALHAWQPLAQRGNAVAQNWLGRMYQQGLGVHKDEMEAVRLYRQAAAQGYAAAQSNLGFMYAEGRGVAKDETEAVRLFRQAAAQGYALGQYGMGLMYEQGWGVARDLVEAQRRFTQAAETASFASDRNKAMQARERVTRQLASPQTPASYPASVAPPTPTSVASSSRPMGASSHSEVLHRRALIIGNAAYPNAPLRNPINDATDIADILRRFGFEVSLLRDADKLTMEHAVEDFTTGVPRRSVGLFFFSGHGAQLDGQNYLIPIGAALGEPSDVKYRAVAADWILARMDDTGMEGKLLILDACRNNPFGRGWTRALNRGLVTMDAPKGSLIAYSTSPGKTAEDGTGRP